MKNRTKGTLLSPLFIGVYAAVLARVCKDLENIYYTRCDVCVCVCVSKISEIDKYKALKSKEESKSLCIVLLLLMLFVVTILSCSDITLLT